MPKPALILAVLLLTGAAEIARAQPVDVTTLAAPDAFSTPGRDTGLPATLWRGASVVTAKTVLPLLASKPLTPAGRQLARRVLATGASGPEGAGTDPALMAARASALSAVGDPQAAATLLARAPGLDRSPDLARAAAELALLAGYDARACAVAEDLSSGRDETYWLRLRAYCQAVGGKTAQAQLTFELAQAQARDPIYGRLMAAKLAGAGDPGPASLRNGLDFALSRSLGLDLAAAKPAPAVAAALAGGAPQPLAFDQATFPPDTAIQGMAMALRLGDKAGGETMAQLLAGLVEMAGSADPKTAARGKAASLMMLMLNAPFAPAVRGSLPDLGVPQGKAPLVRDLALDDAAGQKAIGETALLALWTSAEAGPAGPAMGDRIRIIRALHLVGLDADARAFALEGLLALK